MNLLEPVKPRPHPKDDIVRLTPEDVIFKLGQLEPDEIARVMKDSRVLAVRECSTACAVTQYVYNETKAESIRTGIWSMSYWSSGLIGVRLPDSVLKFIARFDDGFYPELDSMAPENM